MRPALGLPASLGASSWSTTFWSLGPVASPGALESAKRTALVEPASVGKATQVAVNPVVRLPDSLRTAAIRSKLFAGIPDVGAGLFAIAVRFPRGRRCLPWLSRSLCHA